MRCQNHMFPDKTLPVVMDWQKIQAICIQNYCFFTLSCLRQEPLSSFPALRSGSKTRSYHKHITPVKHCLVFFLIKITGDHGFRQQCLQRNPVGLHGLNSHHSRRAFQSSCCTQICSSAHSFAASYKKNLTEGSFISIGTSLRKHF